MKKTIVVIAAATLALTACSGNEGKEAPAGAFSPASEEDRSSPTAGEGDTLALECSSANPCEGSFTITKVTATNKCSQRFDNYGDGIDQLDPGEMYVEMTGEFELRSSGNGWSMLDDPKVVDAQGFTQQATPAFFCHAEAPYQSWSSTLDAGEKSRHFGVWTIPDDATHLTLLNHKIEIPEQIIDDS